MICVGTHKQAMWTHRWSSADKFLLLSAVCITVERQAHIRRWERAVVHVRDWASRRMGDEKVVQVRTRVPYISVMPLSKISCMGQPM